jgi:hypothetical protein
MDRSLFSYDFFNPATASSIFLSNIGDDIVVGGDDKDNGWRDIPELYKHTNYVILYCNNIYLISISYAFDEAIYYI